MIPPYYYRKKEGKMKSLKLLPIYSLLLLLLFPNANAQNKDLSPRESEVIYGTSNNPANIFSGENTMQEKELSPEAMSIIEEMKRIKKSNSPIQRERLLGLQKRFDAITGLTVTENNSAPPLEIITKSLSAPFSDAIIGNTRIYESPNVKFFATATEMRNPGFGTIWAVIGTGIFLNPSTDRDTLRIYKSTDNGSSWFFQSGLILATGIELDFDACDMEIIENATSDYVYIIWSYTHNSERKIQGVVLEVSTLAINSFHFIPPGHSFSSNSLYKPRLSSDNGAYQNSAYVYIICSNDSLIGGNHIATQRFGVMQNPYSTSPAITYKSGSYFWQTLPLSSFSYVWSDVAHFQAQGTDSLIVTYSGPDDNTKVFTAKSSIFPPYSTNINSAAILGGANPTYEKKNARVSSSQSGAYKKVTYLENFSNSGDWDVKFMALPETGAIDGYIDGSSSPTLVPNSLDATGIRNSPKSFRVAYSLYDPQTLANDTIAYAYTSNGLNWQIVEKINLLSGSTVAPTPAPGVRYVGGDSCFALFSTGSGEDVWCALGCSGAIVGIQNLNETPSEFNLSQNYPNPFNPETKIKFSIPHNVKSGNLNTKLTVFDITGREVALLVNSELQTGVYEFTFDGSSLSSGIYFYTLRVGGFTETKKMLLIK